MQSSILLHVDGYFLPAGTDEPPDSSSMCNNTSPFAQPKKDMESARITGWERKEEEEREGGKEGSRCDSVKKKYHLNRTVTVNDSELHLQLCRGYRVSQICGILGTEESLHIRQLCRFRGLHLAQENMSPMLTKGFPLQCFMNTFYTKTWEYYFWECMCILYMYIRNIHFVQLFSSHAWWTLYQGAMISQ